MNNIQMYGMMNSAVNFKANSAKVVTQVVEKTNKSGVYQAAVEKLAVLQRELAYGCYLLRENNWFDPRDVREADKAIYEIYQSKIKNLEAEKEKVIDGMMKQIKENPNYRNLSDDCMKNIREHIDCGSTWGGFYFNDESIMEIINESNIRLQKTTKEIGELSAIKEIKKDATTTKEAPTKDFSTISSSSEQMLGRPGRRGIDTLQKK